MFFKNIQIILSPFLCKKTIKECPVPLDISIKSNRKHHKTVLYSKSNKNIVGQLFGRFFVVFGQFFSHKHLVTLFGEYIVEEISDYKRMLFFGGGGDCYQVFLTMTMKA
jgi:hypothetical protein